MSGFELAARKIRYGLLLVLWTSALTAQTCLVLSPPVSAPDGTASFDLSLYSFHKTAPAAVQWTFQYSPSSISSLSVDDGPTLTAAGKTALCAGGATEYKCLAMGLNANTIANGVIAKVTAVLAPGAATATVQIANPLGATASGNAIPILPMVLSATSGQVSPDCRLDPRLRSPVGGK